MVEERERSRTRSYGVVWCDVIGHGVVWCGVM